jgi:hypothetical protein
MEKNLIEKIEDKAISIIGQKALSFAEKIKLLPPIKSTEEYIAVGELWKSGRELLKEIDNGYDDLIAAAHKLHKDAVAKKATYYAPADQGVRAAKKLMSDYDAEQERIRKAEEDRLQKIAQKEAEDRRLQEAIEAEKAGKKAEAETIIETPVTVAPVVVAKKTPKMEGGPVYRTIWKFRIKNADLIPREYLIPDEVKIGGLVRSMKSATSISGVEVYEERC